MSVVYLAGHYDEVAMIPKGSRPRLGTPIHVEPLGSTCASERSTSTPRVNRVLEQGYAYLFRLGAHSRTGPRLRSLLKCALVPSSTRRLPSRRRRSGAWVSPFHPLGSTPVGSIPNRRCPRRTHRPPRAGDRNAACLHPLFQDFGHLPPRTPRSDPSLGAERHRG